MGEHDELLDTASAARVLNIAAGTLTQWRYRRTGPVYVKVGHAVRYRRSDLAAWIDANTRAAAS